MPATSVGFKRITAILALTLLFWTGMKLCSAQNPKADDKQQADADPYAVPNGSPEELLKFMQKMLERPEGVSSVLEAQNHLKKAVPALVAAADKILASKADEKILLQAIEFKVTGLQMLGRMGDAAAEQQLKAFSDSLKNEKRPALAAEGVFQVLLSTARLAASTQDVDGIKKVVADLKEVASKNTTGKQISLGKSLADFLDQAGDSKAAAQAYKDFAELAAKSSDPAVIELGQRLAGSARRANLVGNSMQIEGKLLDGKPVDWASYKGKVVLVDFWATWCGPCVAELPNVKENYAKFHDRGFEVLGISLDQDRQAVERFLDDSDIPWTTLYSDVSGQNGWEHPMAINYGINSIPAAILINQQGNVVTLNARGEALGQELEKLLGIPEAANPEEKK